MSKQKETGKEASKSSTKIPVAKESSAKVPVAKESSAKVPVAKESSAKIPVAKESSAKVPAARKSSTKVPAARASSSGGERESIRKIKITEARPSTKVKAALGSEPSDLDEHDEIDDEEEGDHPKRAMGLRGAAPWAARHAAKHAAEARRRAAVPPPPGSARATIRTPSDIEEIKARIIELHNAIERVKALRKNLSKSFFDLGQVLHDIQELRLFEAKGFQNFESFIERETDLGKSLATRLVKLIVTFSREQAMEMGYESALASLAQMEGSETPQTISDSRIPIARAQPSTSIPRDPTSEH